MNTNPKFGMRPHEFGKAWLVDKNFAVFREKSARKGFARAQLLTAGTTVAQAGDR